MHSVVSVLKIYLQRPHSKKEVWLVKLVRAINEKEMGQSLVGGRGTTGGRGTKRGRGTTGGRGTKRGRGTTGGRGTKRGHGTTN